METSTTPFRQHTCAVSLHPEATSRQSPSLSPFPLLTAICEAPNRCDDDLFGRRQIKNTANLGQLTHPLTPVPISFSTMNDNIMAHLQHPIFGAPGSQWHPASGKWDQFACLPPNERASAGFPASRGHLIDDPHADAIIWNVLLFGPAASLLIFAPWSIYTLYRAKLVTAPNYRGIAKAVSLFRCEQKNKRLGQSLNET